jgi:manganese/zinc/iron transport system ATP- binding protein
MKTLLPAPLEVHNLSVAYQNKPVLWSIDFSLTPGKLTAIVGPNGAGKSTLIKAVLGLIPKTAGDVLVNGKPVESVRKSVAYVPQRESVDWDFPIQVFDVVLMGRYPSLGLFKRPGAADRERAMKAIEETGLAGFEKRQISQLSGGQQQRVFLARALAQDADLFIMDEPFAGVDAATESSILEVLRKLRNQGKTVFVVHHDLQTVAEYFDEILMLNLTQMAFGPVQSVFTRENLQKTYGGRLTILSDVLELAKERNFVREQGHV